MKSSAPQVQVSGLQRAARVFALLLFSSALSGTMVPAYADRGGSVHEQRLALSLDEAADQVRGAFGGQVIAASSARANGREGYRIRVILDDGRVITVFVDAESGAMRQMG